MPEQIKVLLFILILAIFVFYFSRKAFEGMLQPNEFDTWRKTWVIITIVAFLAGNFWLYIFVCAIFILYVARPLENKFALYLVLLLAIPPIQQRIPGLFDLNYHRLLAIVILLPVVISPNLRKNTPSLGQPLMDKLLLALIVLATLLTMRGTTPTDALRSGLVFFLDWFLPYFAASRMIQNFKQLKTVLIAFTVACLIAGAIGSFEYASHWLLYNALADSLKINFDMGSYLGRGDGIRAISSLGHPLALGLVMIIAMGFYLFLAPSIKSKFLRWGVFLGITAGLIAPISRGPWVGAAILLLIFMASGPKIIKRFTLLLIATLIAIQVLPAFPGGQKVINLLPFVGNTENENVEYREKLLAKSIIIIKRNPLFGVFDARLEPEMDEMLQGEGIIDIVNSYLGIALSYGLTGFILFVWIFSLALYRLRRTMNRIKDKKSEEYLCGRSLFATMIALMVTIFTVSGIGVIPVVTYALVGIIFSYTRILNNIAKAKAANW